MDESPDQRAGKLERPSKRALKKPAAVSANKRLELQTRKVLGKHYANKYRSGRG